MAAVMSQPAVKAKRKKTSPYACGEDNGRVFLTCQRRDAETIPRIVTIPTKDPYDRAHLASTGLGVRQMFIPAAFERDDGSVAVNTHISATPRRYPASSMTSAGVSIDSMFDAWHALKTELARQGITLGSKGLVVRDLDGMDKIRLRDLVQPKRRIRKRSDEERELSRRATEILRKARP